jgi:DNA-binding transcriptional LysR family regulator
MMLTLRKLQQIVVLADEGHFTRAAEKLGMTQPSLSRSVAELEQSCGLRLFDRGGHRITPTAAGADLVRDARRVLGQVGGIERNLLLQSRGAAGRVALGLGPLAASYLLAKLLSECLGQWPSLVIVAAIDTTDALIQKLLDGQVDFCVCATNQLQSTPALAIRPLGAFKLGYFVRAGHPLANAKAPLTWEDLAPFPRAVGTMQPPAEPSLERIFGPLGSTVECDDYEVIRQAVGSSDMVWLASEQVLERELAESRVVEIHPSPDELPDAEIALVRLAGRSQSPAMLRTITLITAIMNEGAPVRPQPDKTEAGPPRRF